MTMIRDTTMLLPWEYPLTAAEWVEVEAGDTTEDAWWEVVHDRAHWEAGYTAGLANAQPAPGLFNQLRANEETIARLAAQLAEARAACEYAVRMIDAHQIYDKDARSKLAAVCQQQQ